MSENVSKSLSPKVHVFRKKFGQNTLTVLDQILFIFWDVASIIIVVGHNSLG
jgi:hypothetical protein